MVCVVVEKTRLEEACIARAGCAVGQCNSKRVTQIKTKLWA